MKRLMAAAFFVMLAGAISCSSDPCSQSSGCSMGGSSNSNSSLCNNNSGSCSAKSNKCNSTCCNCKSGYHQVGSGSSAYCAKNQ